MSSLRLAAVVALALVLGCKAKPAEGEDAGAGAEQVVSSAPVHAQTVELVEAGAEPHERVRYTSPAPARMLSLATYTERFGEMAEAPFIDIRISWVGEASGMTWEIVELGGELGSDARRDPVSQGIIKAFENVGGRAESDVRGQLSIIQTTGMQTTPSIPLQLDLFVVPLPEEPIGVGASWTATARYPGEIPSWREREPSEDLSLGGLVSDHELHREAIEVTLVERYTLIALDGAQLTIRYALETAATGGEGFSSSEARGQLVVGLDDPLAREGSIEHRTQISAPAVDGVEGTAHYSRQRFVLGSS